MRAAFAIPLLVVLTLPVIGWADPPEVGPAAATNERNEAKWADWDAEARITEGDYEGAVQAEQLAKAERHKAEQQELTAGAAKRPDPGSAAK